VGEPLIEWVDAFVDVPTALATDFRAFWSSVTGWPESSPRGDRGQFRSLLPPQGSAYLRIQELDDGPRLHLDLTSADLDADAARLEGLGAIGCRSRDGVRILRSPAGQIFCLVVDDEPRPVVPRDRWATRWDDGHRSRLIQICLDVPPAAHDAELDFWAAATGWARRPSSYREFTHLLAPDDVPLQLLVQRMADPGDQVGAHLDLATDDVDGEVRRLRALGAVEVGPVGDWHVLQDPVVGLPFCVVPLRP
jgi:Glyoxalase-like domain